MRARSIRSSEPLHALSNFARAAFANFALTAVTGWSQIARTQAQSAASLQPTHAPGIVTSFRFTVNVRSCGAAAATRTTKIQALIVA